MKETKFYVSFLIYLLIGAIASVYVFGLMADVISKLDNYLLGITIAIPILMLLLFLDIIGSSQLALISSLGKKEVDKNKFLESLKIMLGGVGIIFVSFPIYYLIENTSWVIQSGYSGVDIPLGGIIVSSLIIIGGICVLSETYLAVADTIEKSNARIKAK